MRAILQIRSAASACPEPKPLALGPWEGLLVGLKMQCWYMSTCEHWTFTGYSKNIEEIMKTHEQIFALLRACAINIMNIISSFAWISQFTPLGMEQQFSELSDNFKFIKVGKGSFAVASNSYFKSQFLSFSWCKGLALTHFDTKTLRSLAVSDCWDKGSQKALCAADISAPCMHFLYFSVQNCKSLSLECCASLPCYRCQTFFVDLRTWWRQ